MPRVNKSTRGVREGGLGGWRCHALRHRGREMDDSHNVMTLVVLFGIGLAGFLAYGSRRLNQLEAELRRQADEWPRSLKVR